MHLAFDVLKKKSSKWEVFSNSGINKAEDIFRVVEVN